MKKYLSGIIFLFALLTIIPILYFSLYFIYKYTPRLTIHPKITNIPVNDWIMITGPSSGIGLSLLNKLTTELYNISKNKKYIINPKFCLLGRNLSKLQKDFQLKYPNIKFKIFNVDFANSQNINFFNEIENWLLTNKVSLLINNIGHRAITNNFSTQSLNEIRETINCGTMPQIRLTQLIMKQYEDNPINKVSIINITAQCFTYNTGLGVMYKPTISVPYLSVYEATNAFGFYLGESIFSEIKLLRKKNKNKWSNLQFLNITPGAVVTNKTKNALDWIPFSCSDIEFANGVIDIMSKDLEGQQCANWKHELSNILMFFAPFLKEYILSKVGKSFIEN